jgi:hypothetical protein
MARLFVRIIRCWGPVGRGGVLLESGLQRFHTLAELCQFVLEGVHIGLDCRWGVLSVLRHEGKWPAGGGGLRQRFHDVSRQYTKGQTAGQCIAERGDQVQRKMLVERETPSART